jgi:hypothetical protein
MCAAQVVYMRFSLLPLSRISVLEVCILGRVKCSSDRVTFGNFLITVNPHVCHKDMDGIFVAGNLYWDPGI